MVMASCATNEEVYTPEAAQQEIGFEGYTQKATSRAALEDTTLPTDNSYTMHVTAAYLDSHKTGQTAYVTYFQDEVFDFTGDAETGAWKDGWYYPLSGTIEFMAYAYPAACTTAPVATWSYTDTGVEGRIKQVVLDCTDLTGAEDIMYSELKDNISCPQNQNVSLTFSHALAWLQFNVKSATANVIEIQKIVVNDVSLNGDLTVVAANANASGSWQADAVDNVTILNANGEAVQPYMIANTDKFQEYGNLLIVPTTDGRKTATITYTITNSGGESAPMTYVLDLAETGKTWDEGNKYVYNITITPYEITFNTQVDVWTATGNESNPVIPVI